MTGWLSMLLAFGLVCIACTFSLAKIVLFFTSNSDETSDVDTWLEEHDLKQYQWLFQDKGSLDIDGVSRWDDIRATYDLDKSSAEFCMLHKLKDSHLAPIGTQKMKVTQVLSHSVAATINAWRSFLFNIGGHMQL